MMQNLSARTAADVDNFDSELHCQPSPEFETANDFRWA
jgi:hypothetical protein